jgi:pimeloyl-ACP methyl ester carboxylesterase
MTTTTPASSPAPRTVVFVHGLWLHSRSWQCWIETFREAGYEASAPGWPGEMSDVLGTRTRPAAIAKAGFDELVRHYADHVIGATPLPVLTGHEYGGRLVHRLVELGLAAGGIAIDAVGGPPGGEIDDDSATCRLNRDAFADYYGRRISRAESDQLFDRWAIPAPGAAVSDAVSPAEVDRASLPAAHGPFLLIVAGPVGEQPRYVGVGGVTDVHSFSDRGLSLTIDSGWREIAESCLAWLDAQEL